ncbi:MAG: 3-hydroxyacyl-CoA dehydrogenase family protein, partial [Actinomycetota bacterium]
NRLLFPMINDAFALVEDGSSTPEDVDAVVEGSFGHPIGPIALADLVGLDVTERIVESLAAADPLLPRPSGLLRDLVRAGVLGRKSGRGARDEGWAGRIPRGRKSGQEPGRP